MPTATLTPNYLTGQAVAVSVGGALAYCESGNSDRSVNAVKVTNARSGGFGQHKAGTKQAKGTINCVYNGDDPPTGIVEGAEVTLIIDAAGYETSQNLENAPGSPPVPTVPHGRLITMQALITNVGENWQCEQDYKWKFDWMSTGAYTVVDTATGASPIT